METKLHFVLLLKCYKKGKGKGKVILLQVYGAQRVLGG
jgi:hypothetical protein